MPPFSFLMVLAEMRINNNINEDLEVNGDRIERVAKFHYLGSIVVERGVTDQDALKRTNKAKAIWPVTSNMEITQTQNAVWMSNLETVQINSKANTNRYLRNIINIRWSERISDEELWNTCQKLQGILP